jgi:serine phosphatase RsbU (regulator of sigma subunit)
MTVDQEAGSMAYPLPNDPDGDDGAGRGVHAFHRRRARTVQAHLQAPPRFRARGLDCAALSIPAGDVGGDAFDFIPVSPRRTALVIADVAGKGVPAALLMAHLQAMLRSDYALGSGDLEARLCRANAALLRRVAPGHYATLFAGEYDDGTGCLRYVNCGHVPPLVLRGDGGVTQLDATTTAVGLFDAWPCPVAEITLAPGDLLVACTDGVTEAPDAAGNEFGLERWQTLALAARHLELPALLRAIATAVRRYAGAAPLDDLTLIAARRRAASPPPWPLRARAVGHVLLARNRSAPCSST